jgi:hypothetical protein
MGKKAFSCTWGLLFLNWVWNFQFNFSSQTTTLYKMNIYDMTKFQKTLNIEAKSMYLRGRKKNHYLPFFLHLCGHQTTSIIILYILTYKVVVQTTNPTLEVQWCIFELSFVSFVCHQEAIPWWHFRSNWNTYTHKLQKWLIR